MIVSSELDSTTKEILQVLFQSFSALLLRLVSDHLPGGEYEVNCEVLGSETQSVPKTNVVSERDFAKLDRFLREKPNASTLSLEALILFSNNKTAEWLRQKSPEELTILLKNARIAAPEFRKLYNERKQKMIEEHEKLLKSKEMALFASQQKKIKEKEKLTNEVLKYGLWQSEKEVQDGLGKLQSMSLKIAALKVQFDFRKKVLQQKHPDKTVFYMSKNRRKLTVDGLVVNLCKLLTPTPEFEPMHTEELVGNGLTIDGLKMDKRGGILAKF